MPKARVYELAKELGVDSKTVLSKLEAMGEFVKSASSTVEPPVARKLRNAFASSGQGNASDSKKPAIRPRSLSNRHLIPCQSRPLRQHRSRLPPQRRSRIMPLPSPMPRSRAIARRVQANPASMAIVLTATPRVRRVETAASPVARRPFRELAPSMATLRRAATTPMARSRTPRDRARATIRSAASRACTPRLRVIFRVRIR